MTRAVGAELRHAPAALRCSQSANSSLRPGIRERQPQVVARRARDRAEVAEQRDRGVVPGQVVPAASEHVSPDSRRGSRSADAAWARLARPGSCTAAPPRRGRAGSGGCARPASAAARGERLEHVERGAHVAALLEPRVPGGAHARELRDLLAPQARCAAPAAARQPHVLGLECSPALAQEVGELLARRSPLPLPHDSADVDPLGLERFQCSLGVMSTTRINPSLVPG